MVSTTTKFLEEETVQTNSKYRCSSVCLEGYANKVVQGKQEMLFGREISKQIPKDSLVKRFTPKELHS